MSEPFHHVVVVVLSLLNAIGKAGWCAQYSVDRERCARAVALVSP